MQDTASANDFPEYEVPISNSEDVQEPQVPLDLGVQPRDPHVINVSTVPQLSPFRYPGGKTWLVPYVRDWLATLSPPIDELVEPFAGGGIVALTAIVENYARVASMAELDDDIASVWETMLNGKGMWLANAVATYPLIEQGTSDLAPRFGETVADRALRTIIRNRVSRGGILAPGAGVVKNGENGRGLLSRWYPETLRTRITRIVSIKERIRFVHGDGMELISQKSSNGRFAFFVDPPYVKAGRRLYLHSEIDHSALFRAMSDIAGSFLMTYDDAPEIRKLALDYGFAVGRVPMKSTHHETKWELLISRDLCWLGV